MNLQCLHFLRRFFALSNLIEYESCFCMWMIILDLETARKWLPARNFEFNALESTLLYTRRVVVLCYVFFCDVFVKILPIACYVHTVVKP